MSTSVIRTGAGSGSTVAAFVLGWPLGFGVLWAILHGPLQHPLAIRYLEHPVEQVELILFFMALAALFAKLTSSFREKRALTAEIVPGWNGKAVPPAEAGVLLRKHAESLERWGGTWIGRRYHAVLEFVKSRGSANELDDQLRTLADNDIMSQEASYSLIRFITWAIPILGFLGTVLGITDAISGVTPEALEKEMHKVTGGLSLAFDATALGLGLTMILMFLSFLVERREQSVLEQVDATVEAELGHRFQRMAADQTSLVNSIEASSQQMYDTAEALVRRQSELWSQSLERIVALGRDSAVEQHQRLAASLEQAIQGALAKHVQRLAEVESQMLDRQEKVLMTVAHLADVLHATSQKHQQGLIEVSQRLAQQTAALAHLQDGGAELTRLQESLAQNLSTLAGTGAFEEAVQSLTAAIHLLTTRVAAPPKRVA